MAGTSIIATYGNATIEERIVIIINNYANFLGILEGYEKSLAVLIQSEKDSNRRSGDLGIRVQSFGMSDPTMEAADKEISILKAIRNGDFSSGLLEDTDTPDFFRRQILICIRMHEDYEIISNQFSALEEDERVLFKKYLMKEKSIQTLADEEGIEYESFLKRVRKWKAVLKQQSNYFLQLKYRRGNAYEENRDSSTGGCCKKSAA